MHPVLRCNCMALELEYGFFLWKFGLKFLHFQNGVFDLYDQLQYMYMWIFLSEMFFVKATDVQNKNAQQHAAN